MEQALRAPKMCRTFGWPHWWESPGHTLVHRGRQFGYDTETAFKNRYFLITRPKSVLELLERKQKYGIVNTPRACVDNVYPEACCQGVHSTPTVPTRSVSLSWSKSRTAPSRKLSGFLKLSVSVVSLNAGNRQLLPWCPLLFSLQLPFVILVTSNFINKLILSWFCSR